MTTGTYEYQSDFARKYYGEGKAEGKAEGRAEAKVHALITILAARGIAVSSTRKRQLRECTDLDTLDTWIQRAATATTINDLFD